MVSTSTITCSAECTRTILLVEPAPAMARLLRTMLRDLGFNVIETTGPEQALNEVQKRASEIHVVVSKFSLPEVSGPKLASFLAQCCPDVSVVLIADAHVPERMAGSNRSTVLQKPFTRAQLAQALDGMQLPQHV